MAGLSLAYLLAKQENTSKKILVFDSNSFAQTCSLHSTAVVAGRGVSEGHSALGDALVKAFETFKLHVKQDSPQGIYPIKQHTVSITKLDSFKLRYPSATECASAGIVSFQKPQMTFSEDAFLVDPEVYLDWLRHKAKNKVEFIPEFVTHVSEEGELTLKTQSGAEWKAHQIVFAAGSWNPLWNSTRELKIKSQKVHGAYLEFSNVEYGHESFSLTFEGDNFIYHGQTKKLLIGSTTDQKANLLASSKKLLEIYQRLTFQLQMKLPDFHSGEIKVGLREKAPKREPYISHNGNLWSMGGLYKNGFSLGMFLANSLIQKMSDAHHDP